MCSRCYSEQRLLEVALESKVLITFTCSPVRQFIIHSYLGVKIYAWQNWHMGFGVLHAPKFHSCYQQPLSTAASKPASSMLCSHFSSKKSLKFVRISMMHFECIKKRDISSHTDRNTYEYNNQLDLKLCFARRKSVKGRIYDKHIFIFVGCHDHQCLKPKYGVWVCEHEYDAHHASANGDNKRNLLFSLTLSHTHPSVCLLVSTNKS